MLTNQVLFDMAYLSDEELDKIVEEYRHPFLTGATMRLLNQELISYRNMPIAQRGEITLIFGQAKTRRSAFNNLLASIALGFQVDGFKIPEINFEPRILVIDTNHSRYDSLRMLNYIDKRIGGKVLDCEYINMRVNRPDVQDVEGLLERAASQSNPYDIVILDEITDFVSNTEDTKWQFAGEVWALTKKYNCAVIVTAYDCWWPDAEDPDKVFWGGEAFYKGAKAIMNLSLNNEHQTEIRYIYPSGHLRKLPFKIGNLVSGLPYIF